MNEIEAEVEAVPSEAPIVDEKEALRQSIERNEAELRDAVDELTTAVKHEITLGGQIIDHPTAWLAGGFVIGMLIAWR